MNEVAQTLYTTAYSFYQNNDYTTAAQLFTKLSISDPFCTDYWNGLAAAEQMNTNYSAALHAWCLVALLNPQDPQPHFHAAQCYLSLNETQEALKAFDAAKTLLNLDIPEHQALQTQIEVFTNNPMLYL